MMRFKRSKKIVISKVDRESTTVFTVDQIKKGISNIFAKHPMYKKVTLYSDYAAGCANRHSDIQIIVERDKENELYKKVFDKDRGLFDERTDEEDAEDSKNFNELLDADARLEKELDRHFRKKVSMMPSENVRAGDIIGDMILEYTIVMYEKKEESV